MERKSMPFAKKISTNNYILIKIKNGKYLHTPINNLDYKYLPQ